MKTFLSALLFMLCISAFAQDTTYIITATKGLGGYRFEQDGKTLRIKSLASKMLNDPKAFSYIMQAKSKASAANILGGIGAFLLVYPLAIDLAGGSSSLRPMAFGSVLILFGFPLSISAGKNAKTAVDIYNMNNRNITLKHNNDLKLGLCATGLSLKFCF